MSEPSGSPASILVMCPDCDQPVLGEPVASIVYDDPEDGPPARWTLLRCGRQGHPLLVVQEDYGLGFDEDDAARMYPPRDRPLSSEIPQPLRREHSEARKCFDAKAYTAAVVMVRRTLEGVCALQNVPKGPLSTSLPKMRESGLIDGRLYEWAQELRLLGNAGAHYTGQEVPREDAEDALAFNDGPTRLCLRVEGTVREP